MNPHTAATIPKAQGLLSLGPPDDDELLDALSRELIAKATAAFENHRRYILGIAGIGGAGKSTLATRLLTRIEQITAPVPRFACILPMDGFHYTNDRLEELGLLERKGAPETFGADNYIAFLGSAGHNTDFVSRFAVYSRDFHDPVFRDDDSQAVLLTTRMVITEGNYLLLDRPPWSRLADVLDECWLLDTPVEQAKQWIIDRHVKGGRSMESALRHYERTDLKNALLMQAEMRKPDRVLRWG